MSLSSTSGRVVPETFTHPSHPTVANGVTHMSKGKKVELADCLPTASLSLFLMGHLERESTEINGPYLQENVVCITDLESRDQSQ